MVQNVALLGDTGLRLIAVVVPGTLTTLTVTAPLMNVLRLKNYAARGIAAGLASHGIGTARAFQVDPLADTFAGITLGLNGLLTALLVPLLVKRLVD